MNLKKLTKTERFLESALNYKNAYVEVGHFSESGEHPEAEMSYVDLMKLHHTGVPEFNIPSRPVLDILESEMDFEVRERDFIKQIKRIKDSKLNDKKVANILQKIGKEIAEREADIFGSSKLADNSNPRRDKRGALKVNSPLIDENYLIDAISYRDSITKKIKRLVDAE